METHQRKPLVRSFLINHHPILYTGVYSGSTPLHLGIEFLQACDEAVSESGTQANMVFILTPKSELYESQGEPNESDLNWSESLGTENEHNDEEQKASLYRHRRCQTKLSIDGWFLDNGYRGKTARHLSKIQIVYVSCLRIEACLTQKHLFLFITYLRRHLTDLAQLAVFLSTFPGPYSRLEAISTDSRIRNRIFLIVHDMSVLPVASPLDSPETAPTPAPPSSPSRSASGPLHEDLAENRLSAYLAIVGHALATLDFTPGRYAHITGSFDCDLLLLAYPFFEVDCSFWTLGWMSLL